MSTRTPPLAPPAVWLGLALAASGCVVTLPEHDAQGPLDVSVTALDGVPVADGAQRFEVRVRGDAAARAFREEISLAAFGGTFANGESAYTARLPADGELVALLVAGRRPGPLVVQAQAGGFVAWAGPVTLAARAPDGLSLDLAAPVLAPGESTALRIDLTVDDPLARPSWGSTVGLRVCCDADGAPERCADEVTPVAAPNRVMLDEGEAAITVELTAVGAGGDAEGGEDAAAEPLVAHVVAALGEAPARCDAGARVRIEVRP